MPAVQEINYSSSVHRIARQTIRIPTDDTVCLTTLYPVEHRIKKRTTRNFCRLFFYQLLNDIEPLGFRVGAQFRDLCFKTQIAALVCSTRRTSNCPRRRLKKSFDLLSTFSV